MRINIKTLKNLEISDELKSYAREKIAKYERLLEEPASCEIVFSDELGPKGGIDKSVRIRLSLPNEKNPVYAEALTDNFMGSIDLAQEKIEQEVIKYKEKKKIGDRFPTKYHETRLQQKEND